ncbi:MAG: aldehyde dehydrogenase (NADP(+)) [Acidobacteriaceae bacterium]|nr:aldehyde dehydrogenase (NADP(+)) [Acidobacteriaceae bacterium]
MELTICGVDPRTGETLEPQFREATPEQVERAVELAAEASSSLRALTAEQAAQFLNSIRDEIAALGDSLVELADRETALGVERLKGERERTLNQLKLFADLVTEGSWVDARIDTALPDRKPLPRADIRRMLQPVGPVAVFGASNFPLAFSVAGGDTASAFAARNPVVVKAHPAHPGTSELVATAIARAVKTNRLPEGTFSMLHGRSPSASISLVNHPKLKAVGFTGSLRAGRALFDAAAKRPQPIPVYAEMGSVNPVFVLPQTVNANADGIADGLFRSVTLGVGQFCTSPGLVFGVKDQSLDRFQSKLIANFEQSSPASMLNAAIAKGYAERFKEFRSIDAVKTYAAQKQASAKSTEGAPGLFVVDAEAWEQSEALREEIFGPATVLVRCETEEEMLEAARTLEGSLTATIHGSPEELQRNQKLIDLLTQKAGRLIFNGYPTGVEVGYAMHHGGPYPSTTDEKFTSVGTTAIYRFARPICYQNFPDTALPPELQNANPRQIWRTINGKLTREAIA